MPAAIRLGDFCSGHGCFPSRANVEASTDVFINDLGAHREGDGWSVHSCKSSHAGVLAQGSSTVFINDKPAGRIGDPISCGSIAAQGSPDVFIG